MRARLVVLLLLVVASVAGTLLLLEAGLRLMPDAAPDPEQSQSQPIDGDLPVLRNVFELAKPNQHGLYKGVPYRTNSAGFRGPETPRAKPPGTFRIIVGGDSVTMGSGVHEADTYANRIGDLLEVAPGHRYEVLNLGTDGLNAEHVMQRLTKIGGSFAPDLIVYGFTLNDLEGPAYVYRRPNMQHRGAEESMIAPPTAGSSRLLALLRERFAAARELAGTAPDSYAAELQANYFENPTAWSHFVTQLARMAEMSRTHEVCGVVFIHASLHYLHALHPFTPIYELVASAAEEQGLHVVESLPTLLGHDPSSLWVNFVDPHPNAEGHRLLAEALAAGIRALPTRCLTPS